MSSKTIKEHLDWRWLEDILYEYPEQLAFNPIYEYINKNYILKSEIQEIINECKPGSAYVGYDDNPQELHENRLYNSGIDQYQSNLEKRLK